jgi:hypothetical protein
MVRRPDLELQRYAEGVVRVLTSGRSGFWLPSSDGARRDEVLEAVSESDGFEDRGSIGARGRGGPGRHHSGAAQARPWPRCADRTDLWMLADDAQAAALATLVFEQLVKRDVDVGGNASFGEAAAASTTPSHAGSCARGSSAGNPGKEQ